MNGVLWLVIVILLESIGPIIYLVVRSDHPVRPHGDYPPRTRVLPAARSCAGLSTAGCAADGASRPGPSRGPADGIGSLVTELRDRIALWSTVLPELRREALSAKGYNTHGALRPGTRRVHL